MPWALILIVVGLVLALATTHVLLGWILFGIGVVLVLIVWLIIGVVFGAIMHDAKKKNYKKYGGF